MMFGYLIYVGILLSSLVLYYKLVPKAINRHMTRYYPLYSTFPPHVKNKIAHIVFVLMWRYWLRESLTKEDVEGLTPEQFSMAEQAQYEVQKYSYYYIGLVIVLIVASIFLHIAGVIALV
jgi:hypothetical protein